MLKCQSDESNISIRGYNRMDHAMIAEILTFITVLGGIAAALITKNIFYGLLIGLILLGVLLTLKPLLKFSIVISHNLVSASKSFAGIEYSTISGTYKEALYNEKANILAFNRGENAIQIEQHEGFEVDCLLVCIGKRCFEFGNKDESAIMFKTIRDGLIKMEIKLSPSAAIDIPRRKNDH